MENNIFCDQCGEKISTDSRYCVKCGNVLNANDDVEYEIKGDNLPFVTIKMNLGDRIISESGAMSWRTNNIKMETTSNEGIEKVVSRILTSESLFQNIYTSLADNEKITFSSINKHLYCVFCLCLKHGKCKCRQRRFLGYENHNSNYKNWLFLHIFF